MTFWTLTIGATLTVAALAEVYEWLSRRQLRRDYPALMAKSLRRERERRHGIDGAA